MVKNESFQFGMSPSDSAAIVQFLDENLRPGAGFSVREEFPSVFGEYPGANSFYAQAGGRVVGHAAFMSRVFRHPLFHFKVGLIGSVVTAEAYRGHGIASTLLREALAQLKNSGCLFAVLWAENADFYRPLGFERVGREQSFRFSAASIADDEIRDVVQEFDSARHLEGLWRLYHQHSLTVDRSIQEFKRLTRIPHARIFVTVEADTVTSYTVVHKGLDFENYIHEWGGRLECVRSNVAFLQKKIFKQQDLTLIAPGEYDLAKLRSLSQESHRGVLGMAKLLDRQRLRALYLDYLKATGNKLWMTDEWGGDGRSMPLKTDAEFMRAVLGEEKPAEHPTLPFFLWGFDSI